MDEVKEPTIVDEEVRDKEKDTKLIEPSSPGDEFELTAEMMVNDFDDERTLDEEEALEEAEEQQSELSNLEKEKDMPIEALLAMYGYNEVIGDGEEPPIPPNPPVSKPAEEVVTITEEVSEAVTDEHHEEVMAQQPETADEETTVVGSQGHKEAQPSLSEEIPMDIDVEPNKDEEEPDVENPASLGSQDDNITDDVDKEPPSMLHELYKDDPTVASSVSGSRHLRCSRQHSEEDEEEEEDVDYSPNPDAPEEDWKKTIMVGTDYQAIIPDEGLQKYDDAMPYENEDKLLWDPHELMDKDIKDFLVGIQSAQTTVPEGVNRIPKGSHVRDDEQALYLFLQCGLNPDEAIRRQTINSIPSMTSSSLWSEEECRNFESGLRQYGKDFHTIQQNRVRTRTVSELVQFYYLWKKTERHDLFAVKARLEKKKYILHPGTTDFMERFLDEQDSPATSPNVHSLLSGDPKRHKTPPLPQQTNNNNTAPLDTITTREVTVNNHFSGGDTEHIPEQADDIKSSNNESPLLPNSKSVSVGNTDISSSRGDEIVKNSSNTA